MVKVNGAAIAIYIIFSIAILVGAIVFIRLKLKTKLKPFLVGGLTWLAFSVMLEGSLNAIILTAVPSIRANIFIFAIFGGLMAGIFEELGRYLAFKVFLKRDIENDKNALAYAAGHGGFEAVYILLTTVLSIIVMAAMINGGAGEQLGDQLPSATESIKSLTAPMALLAVAERISAIIAHFALTVFVWFSFKEGKPALLFVAIGVHAAFDAASLLLANVLPVWAVEIAILIMAAAIGAAGRYVWKKHHTAETALL